MPNIMLKKVNKLNTYFWYFIEYMKHGDLLSVVASFNYLFFKKSLKADRIIKSSIGTFFCRKNTNDFQFANYHYEWGVKRFILKRAKEYTLYIDGGAGIGDYSILLAKFKMRCIAFEPIPATFEVLELNLQLNYLDRKAALPVALGNENKTARFAFNPVNTGASHLDKGNNPQSIPVEIRTFDSLLPELKIGIDEYILFKLDVEGMEFEAIQGASWFISTYPHLLIIFEEKHSEKETIFSFLNELAIFEYGIVDEFNVYAKKLSNKHLI